MDELTPEDFSRSIRSSTRRRLMGGAIRDGQDVVALRRFVGLTQEQLAGALGVSRDTLRCWEQGCERPEGRPLELLRLTARHPHHLLHKRR